MSFPWILTVATWPCSTACRNCVNDTLSSRFCNCVENCQIMTPTTTRTIQNNKLLRVEFNLRLLTALLSRISPLDSPSPFGLGLARGFARAYFTCSAGLQACRARLYRDRHAKP